ncbi:neuroblastoma-amplified sequence-like isoform X4 [Gymnodraco acuticeps]|uniref:Neuroblastoma-amplified sequence-like isoform X4 n=1 Tax=Gymnodraco acuticeps TaxID=8218 RepID=A0A6P8TWF1_GYMAC|nr:neuroblastoma-amplified sequence-like isoform X4 [Gymnodraco acuticeps]XP_034060193.1 neuroblastoma-amplified sequence-like isoform X4 [Gymnodraco acuticeps]XP_034060194.1 neuroblastoma-amplified sequence-like isoform X4 [Gymnodraco acuticeps]
MMTPMLLLSSHVTFMSIYSCEEHNISVIAKAVTAPPAPVYLWVLCASPISSNGKLLAVVQDQCVEIRSVRDDFGSIIGKCQVPKDPNPQW